MADNQEKLSGSCLCGAVKYSIQGAADKFYHCHCTRCRKANGSGHASNIIMSAVKHFQWLQGEEHVGRYKVPGAKRFETVFCKQCSSALPRCPEDMSYAVIPAGS